MITEDEVKEWVRGFNEVSSSLIERAFKNNLDDWIELTVPSIGDVVYCKDFNEYGEVVGINHELGSLEVIINEDIEDVEIEDVRLEFNSWLPMYYTLWTFGDRLDEYWASRNIHLICDCGFRVFEDNITGQLYLGIDGAGYNFYVHHWEPLYKIRNKDVVNIRIV